MQDVDARLQQLHDSMPMLQLYALVDGVQYETKIGERLEIRNGFLPLFAGTQDAALAHAGPWLVDVAQVEKAFITELAALEQAIPSLSWLISSQALHDLGQHLKKLLDVCLPDGRRALLRFWDPRVLHHLARTLDEPQREALFGHVHEWHLLHNSKRVWIGRPSC